jgi:hypothetical protein
MSDPFYWRTFNILLRLLGIGATFAGAVVVLVFGAGVPAPGAAAPEVSWGALVAGGLVALAGLGFLLLPPFRPDQGDEGPLVNPLRPRRGRRWWTGDPR